MAIYSTNPAVLEAATETMRLIVVAALQSTVVLVLALVAVRCMRACSAASRHLVIFLALAALPILPFLSRAHPRTSVKVEPLSSQSGTHETPGIGSVTVREPLAPVAPSDDFKEIENHTTGWKWLEGLAREKAKRLWESRVSGVLAEWGVGVWLVGAMAALARPLLGLWSLKGLERSAQETGEGPVWELLKVTARVLRLRRKAVLLFGEERRMPMTWGYLKPRILLPREARVWPPERQRAVLLHEMAHVARWDFVTAIITRFLCALYWFNPLVWLAAWRLVQEQEQACDDIVLRAGAGPTRYAETVLHIAAGRPVYEYEALEAVAMARPSNVEGRLLAIMDGKRCRTPLTVFRIMIATAIVGAASAPLSMLSLAQVKVASDDQGIRDLRSRGGLDRGLIAWWRGDGDGKDSAGKHDGEFPFGARYHIDFSGQAFDFDRSSHLSSLQQQRVSIPDSSDFAMSEEMTLEAWVFPLNYGGIILLRGDDRPGYDTWQIDLFAPGNVDYHFNTTNNQSAGLRAPLQLHQWQHLAVTFDHGAMKLYINGVLASSATTELRPIAVLDPRFDPSIGIGNAGGKLYNMPFDGAIKDVRVYNRALNEDEVNESLK